MLTHNEIGQSGGNVVSTVKEQTHHIVEFLDEHGNGVGARQIAFDGADADLGNIILLNVDGGAAKMLLCDKAVIADNTICGVVDFWTYGGKVKGK